MLTIKKLHNKMLDTDVEAVKLTLDMDIDTLEAVSAWVNEHHGHARVSWGSADEPSILLYTLGGWHVVLLGEWIIRSQAEGFFGESQNIMDVIFEEVVEELPQHNAWVDLVARVCHEVNRVIQLNTGDPSPSPKWDKAPDWQKDSAREGVQAALDGQTPEELHESWCAFKQADGWVYGDRKSEKLKMHPCLVPYSELTPDQKLKDFVFSEIVQSFRDAALL
jgi:hypothetical protein